MDAQPKIGGFGCFKGVLQIPFFLLMQFHKAIFYFNPKMGHMLNLAMVDKLNRAGFVVAPYSTPECPKNRKRSHLSHISRFRTQVGS